MPARESQEEMLNIAGGHSASDCWNESVMDEVLQGTALPIAEHGFTLHKGAFLDALCLRYNWTLPHLPTSCVCGAGLTVEHALTCPTGGYTFIRHNEIRDNLAKLLTEVCHDVCIEPHLQPLSSESFTARSVITGDSAWLDVAASGFWGGRFERTFFDVNLFNPHAPSKRSPQLATTYRRHEREKRLYYGQRVLEVEHASFVPFVMSCTGGTGPCATLVLKRLGALLAEKHNSSYSTVMGLLRCRLNFALLRASVMCLRGSRSSFRRTGRFDMAAADLALNRSCCPPVRGTHLPCRPNQPLTLLSLIFPFLTFVFCIISLHFIVFKKN